MTLFSKWLAAVALVLSLVNTALADEAVQSTAVDWKSFERVGNHASVWLLRSFPQTAVLGHQLYPHRSQRVEYVIDCTDRSYALSQWILTDGPEGTGQVVWADRDEALSFVTAAKGTLEAAVVHAACSLEPTTRVAEHQLRFIPRSSPLLN